MPSRYICEIHDDIDAAVKVGRMDLVPGLTEEARVAGKRMEAKLHDYSSLKYDLIKLKKLKAKIAQLKSTEEFIEANLDLPEFDEDEDPSMVPFDESDLE